jgi:hypothetical protein
MSESGQKATSAGDRTRSALPPTTDLGDNEKRRLFGAKTGLMRHSKKTLFDHLIRARKQRRRNGDAKRFGGLEIHD